MDFDSWINLIVNILSSLVIIIPLGVKLFNTLKTLTKE